MTVGETITVDHLKQDPDSEVSFIPLMVSPEEGNVVTDKQELADKAAVLGRVVQHVRGDKIDVFQYRNKTGYRRHIGHRSMLTLVEIAEIRFGDVKVTLDDAKASREKADAEKAAASKAAAEAKAKSREERVQKKAASKAKSAAKSAAKGGVEGGAAKPAAKKAAGKKAATKKAAPKAAAKKKTSE